jgi:hypothetical protein
VEQSLLVTGFGYEHDDPWLTNINLFKEFTDVSRVSDPSPDLKCVIVGSVTRKLNTAYPPFVLILFLLIFLIVLCFREYEG